VFLRRSRGYSPAPVLLKEKARKCVVGLGGELNNVPCVLFQDRAFLGQHIGDVENLETRTFLQDATNHLIHLTNTHVDIVTCDLHPKFNTTELARELAAEKDWPLIQVQHHHAHVAGLIMEHAVDEMVGIVCDGYGYGTDGSAWGGEILYCTRDSPKFKRVGHLESQPQVGGDSATRYPLRMAAGILNKRIDISPWLIEKSNHLPHGEAEATIILQQLRHQNSLLETTSCGRVLDAVAAILGICYERTYEGEPAMKLESVAFSGKDALGLKPKIKGGALDTTELLMAVFENKQNVTLRNLSYSAHAYIANGLASMAIDAASERNVKNVGFTGGAACNEILARIMRYTVEEAGFKFFVHEAVPSGDGGVSFGQAVVGAFSSF
jgi:hydrogenase maturation protein HypF